MWVSWHIIIWVQNYQESNSKVGIVFLNVIITQTPTFIEKALFFLILLNVWQFFNVIWGKAIFDLRIFQFYCKSSLGMAKQENESEHYDRGEC